VDSVAVERIDRYSPAANEPEKVEAVRPTIETFVQNLHAVCVGIDL
jgi:hypothetical protein